MNATTAQWALIMIGIQCWGHPDVWWMDALWHHAAPCCTSVALQVQVLLCIQTVFLGYGVLSFCRSRHLQYCKLRVQG